MSHPAYKFLHGGLAALFALAAAELAASCAQAADYNVGEMHIEQAWARATPKGASTAAGYLTVINHGTTADRLSCVSSDAAALCQVHSMTMDGGVMKMRLVEGGLEIKPGETVMLKPGSFHLMLVDLKHPLKQGETVEAMLQFEKAGKVEVELPVVAIGAPAPGAAAVGGSMQGGSMMQGGGMMQMDKR
jgi:copper(I)-binding protein